jgi:hypothetical protein
MYIPMYDITTRDGEACFNVIVVELGAELTLFPGTKSVQR